MAGDDYLSTPSAGKLKLKGVSDGRLDKKKRRKKPKPDADSTNAIPPLHSSDAASAESPKDNSIVLRTLADEDAQITKDNGREVGLFDGRTISPATATTITAEQCKPPEDVRDQLRTDVERRFEEQRRKRLEERLMRQGVKTHKQRVEELNKYLSGLSEHHDMPKIGPG
ncbi:hypothetical protein LTR70_003313 [Exophiala xenobiotica]|uniref:DUF1754-domain-containing protein n=1 Tax=Lithohypha guttulata TaxID=1690604 RepID=A0ABR0KNQ1_9EURO|nr:hypothetical protein LTR24_001187 [Lithohypha guttulata]KAK5323635.1 hypothetical protein LTR70_003313 [Exophiala xenobiotica]